MNDSLPNSISLVRFVTCASMNLRPLAQTVISGALLLGLSGAILGVEMAVKPIAAQAYTARVDVTLDRLPNESFESLLRRAELVARSAAQRGFDQDILASQVSVIVNGRNRGFEAPVLTLSVSRSQWQARPDARKWATRHRNVRDLLGFETVKP